MQFLGRTEFGLSIMAVERHTHTHTKYTQIAENKKNTYKMQSLPLVSCSPAFPLKPRDGREWLKLVRINLINKCIFFSKQKETPSLLLASNGRRQEQSVQDGGSSSSPKNIWSHQPHFVHCVRNTRLKLLSSNVYPRSFDRCWQTSTET